MPISKNPEQVFISIDEKYYPSLRNQMFLDQKRMASTLLLSSLHMVSLPLIGILEKLKGEIS